MLKLHFIEKSRSFRILWLLEEIGIDYKIIRHDRNLKFFFADPSLKAVHPLGKAPVIEDMIDGQEQAIAESAIIVDYLIDSYAPHLKPDAATASKQQMRAYNYWMHYSEGSLMNFLTTAFVFYKIRTAPMPFFVKPIVDRISIKVRDGYAYPNLKVNIEYIENHLQYNEWFAGSELSGADFMMCFPLEGLLQKVAGTYPMPNSKVYLDKLRQRPAYQKALQLNGDLFQWSASSHESTKSHINPV